VEAIMRIQYRSIIFITLLALLASAIGIQQIVVHSKPSERSAVISSAGVEMLSMLTGMLFTLALALLIYRLEQANEAQKAEVKRAEAERRAADERTRAECIRLQEIAFAHNRVVNEIHSIIGAAERLIAHPDAGELTLLPSGAWDKDRALLLDHHSHFDDPVDYAFMSFYNRVTFLRKADYLRVDLLRQGGSLEAAQRLVLRDARAIVERGGALLTLLAEEGVPVADTRDCPIRAAADIMNAKADDELGVGAGDGTADDAAPALPIELHELTPPSPAAA
jgi:hypothetical protein